MTSREHLHDLVESLPAENLPAAERLIEALREPLPPAPSSFDLAPADDEPESPAERLAVAAAWEEIQAGKGIAHEQVRRRLGAV